MKHSLDDIYQVFKKHPKISIDSRKIDSGCLFFALKGENFNGNDFALQALNKGAAFCIVDEPPQADDSRLLIVDDVLDTLQQLALKHRWQLKIPFIGITGSNGKTTTKELTGAVLGQKFQTFITQGNYNNHIGVPLSILSISEATEIAVIEMGANHQGEIAALCEMAQPDFGVITNIGIAHIEGFGGYNGVIRAKTELFNYIGRRGGRVFVNRDDNLLMEKAFWIDKVTYGFDESAHITGEITGKHPLLSIKINIQGSELVVNSNLAGSYNFYNMMAAAAIGNYFGVENHKIIHGLEHYKPNNNRSQWLDSGKNKIIMDAYNANPTSMFAAINDFAEAPYLKKVVVLGDMLELGEVTKSEHSRVFELVKEKEFHSVFFVGKNFYEVASGHSFHTFLNATDATNFLKSAGIEGCTILVKGSRGIALEKVLEAL